MAAALASRVLRRRSPTVAPFHPALVAPDPAPSGDGEGASANSCPLGKGDPAAECATRSPQLLAAMDTAIDLLVRSRPELFNTQEEAGAEHRPVPRPRPRTRTSTGSSPTCARPVCARSAPLDRERVRREELQRLLGGVGRPHVERLHPPRELRLPADLRAGRLPGRRPPTSSPTCGPPSSPSSATPGVRRRRPGRASCPSAATAS